MMGMKTKSLNETNRAGYVARYVDRKLVKFWLVSFLVFAVFMTPAIANAVTLISQGYLTTSNLPAGSIVSLENNSSEYVDSATIGNSSNILGVVVGSDTSQVSLTSNQPNQVQVVTNGVEQVLVSDINGNISEGDSITASPISGVGMIATGNTKVVGIAQGSFPNTTTTQQTYTDKSGQKHTVLIGQIPVLVSVAYYYKQPNKTLIPPAVQNIADALAGKTVNSLPILLSIGIFIVTLIIVVSIIYAMIHSSIISVGRNPMAQAAVYRNVIQLSALVVVILGVAIISIYMILTRF